jgi:phosphoenolpyruvate carboxykinase (ATP)
VQDQGLGIPVSSQAKVFTKFFRADNVVRKETEHSIDWGEINQKYSPEHYKKLYQSITHDSAGKTLYIKDVAVCADPEITMHVRVISELPWQSLFVHNLFLRKTPEEIQKVSEPDWLVIAVPYFFADPKVHGTRSNNATVINFTERTVLICGSAYAGEIKKSIFSVLNYLLPKQK